MPSSILARARKLAGSSFVGGNEYSHGRPASWPLPGCVLIGLAFLVVWDRMIQTGKRFGQEMSMAFLFVEEKFEMFDKGWFFYSGFLEILLCEVLHALCVKFDLDGFECQCIIQDLR